MKKLFSFAVLTILLTGCSTLDVSVDYDDTYSFENASKIIVVHENKVGENTLYSDRVIDALNTSLESKKYKKVVEPSTADLIFVFYTDVKDKAQINTDYYAMGMRYRFGGMMATTSTYEYVEGTIIIDALEPKTNKIVWRGIGTKELNENKTPQEKTESINKAIHKIMEKFPSRVNLK